MLKLNDFRKSNELFGLARVRAETTINMGQGNVTTDNTNNLVFNFIVNMLNRNLTLIIRQNP